jgi:YjbE family integral membrane protein
VIADSGSNWLFLLATLTAPLQILIVDLLLSADNAIVIAMACRGLPREDMRGAALFGTAGAVGLRIAMAAGAATLLDLPFLKLTAAVALLWIAIRLTLEPGEGANRTALPTADEREAPAPYLIRSVATIVVADAIMSLDNVVAVAMLANGNLFLLGFGLALSIPLLFWGSMAIRRFLDENPLLVMGSGMFLGWLAGGIGVSDPMVAPWIEANAPALPIVIPIACAVLVMWQSLILASGRDLWEGGDAGRR